MRTACFSGHLGGVPGGVCPEEGCLPGGICPGGMSCGCLTKACLPRGCLPKEDICPGGCLPGGVYTDTPQTKKQTPLDPKADNPSPWTNFLTHACENTTFPQLLLQTVQISEKHISLWISLLSMYFLSVCLISFLDNSISFHSASNIKKITVFKYVWI